MRVFLGDQFDVRFAYSIISIVLLGLKIISNLFGVTAARSERDLIAEKMTRLQIAGGVRQARAWEPKTPTPSQ
jgi:hypothetical protein